MISYVIVMGGQRSALRTKLPTVFWGLNFVLLVRFRGSVVVHLLAVTGLAVHSLFRVFCAIKYRVVQYLYNFFCEQMLSRKSAAFCQTSNPVFSIFLSVIKIC